MSRLHGIDRTTMSVGSSRMRRRLAIAATLAAVSAVGALRASSGYGGAATAVEHNPDCPASLLPLGSDPLSPAVRFALARDRPADKPQVIAAGIATTGVGRGAQVAPMCGHSVASRTAAVSIHRRAYDHGPNRSASLAEGEMFAARFTTGWRVCNVAH
jgi:hypothetical protein